MNDYYHLLTMVPGWCCYLGWMSSPTDMRIEKISDGTKMTGMRTGRILVYRLPKTVFAELCRKNTRGASQKDRHEEGSQQYGCIVHSDAMEIE